MMSNRKKQVELIVRSNSTTKGNDQQLTVTLVDEEDNLAKARIIKNGHKHEIYVFSISDDEFESIENGINYAHKLELR